MSEQDPSILEEAEANPLIDIDQYDKNISLALPTLTRFIAGEDISLDNNPASLGMIESLTQRSNTTEQAKSMALRLLIHFMGDVHQPLHTANLYSEDYPEGDKGGNEIDIKYRYTADNLHQVWDTVLYQFRRTIYRPFTTESFAEIGEPATELRMKVQAYLTKDQIETTDFDRIIAEQYDLAPLLYEGVTDNPALPLPDDYVEQWMPTAEHCMVLGANRLAFLISDLFGEDNAGFMLPSIIVMALVSLASII